MSEIENKMGIETNPYDYLIETADEPVRSPVILGDTGDSEKSIKPESTMEIIPLAASASHIKINTREYIWTDKVDLEIEDDLLVPDTFPDMETILNMDCVISEADIEESGGNNTVKCKVGLETMYRSAENYGNNISVIPAVLDSSRQIKVESKETGGKIKVCAKIIRCEYRIINERKYKVKLLIRIDINTLQDKERMIFDGIEKEVLYLKKDKIRFMDMISQKNRECEISEDLQINDEKIRPVKILKSKFTIVENHRQLTKEKLVLNQTIWVRIMYLAEIASKGNLSNQPMFFQGKIDNTQFIPLSKSETEIAACTLNSNVDGLEAEISHGNNGFHISGDIITDMALYGAVEKDIVTDFYHEKEEMTFDKKEETVCCGIENIFIDHTIRESISLQQENSEDYRIIYMDAQIIDISVNTENSNAQIRGKIQLEAVTMNEGDYTVLARKVCEFVCSKELSCDAKKIDLVSVSIREMTGDITAGSAVNLTAHLQVKLNIYNEAVMNNISAPCIVKPGDAEKHYPIVVYTVKDDESLWDIGKKFKVSEECITSVNKMENIKPGKKIVIVK